MTMMLRERGFAAGYGLMLVGLAIMLSGLGIDAYLHAHDPTLASEESVFTLSNPGHLLVAVGIVVILLGACLGPYSRFVLGRRSTALSIAVPVAALICAAALSGVLATRVSVPGHVHTATEVAAAGHTDHALMVLDKNQATVAVEESTMHEPVNSQPITADNMAFAATFLQQARELTAKYQDANAATADGYIRITPDLPLIGAHFWKPGLEGLDPGRPQILLYEQDDTGGWKLAGMAYTLPKTAGNETPPVTQLGGLAHWHYHSNLCFTLGGNVTIATSAAQCNGGVFTAETDWLLHVWVWKDSPEGVFSHANSLMQ